MNLYRFGWGINSFNLFETVSEEKKADFIKKYLPKICPGKRGFDWINSFEDEIEEGIGFAPLFALAISSNEKNLSVHCYANYEEKMEMVAFDFCRLPWEYSRRERNITEKEINSVFNKYLSELGVKTPIGEHAIVYYSAS